MLSSLSPIFLGLCFVSQIVGIVFPRALSAADAGQEFQTGIQPLLKKYCFDCHAKDVTEADIDLAAFGSIADLRKDSKTWVKVRRMLDSGQMPPKDAQKPSDLELAKLQTWVREFLTKEAQSSAGDPGPVLLRRLSNAEYTYTIRDLMGVETLDPTREFPVDAAAGEGFTNTGSGQGMSPALLQKYLNAGKKVAEHLVLLPDGIRFSPHTTPRDRTDALLAEIQEFYRQFTEDGAGMPIDLQGIRFNTNQGGLLPLKPYLAATIAERDALQSGKKTIRSLAKERSLNAKYLGILWESLTKNKPSEPSVLLDSFRSKWQQAKAEDVPNLIGEITKAQKTFWKFNTVGHIGRQGSSAIWMEAVSPLADRKEFRVPLANPPGGNEVTIYLSAGDLGDGNEGDFVLWQRPRIEFPADKSAPARPPILLCDVQTLAGKIERAIQTEVPRTSQYLKAVLDLLDSKQSLETLAGARKLNPELLARWAKLADLGHRFPRGIKGRFTQKHEKVQGYEAINGWGLAETPSMLTNRSDRPITFLTLTIPAHSVVMHPSPVQESFVCWRSPIAGNVRVEGLVADADNKCGNGAAWRVERLSESGRKVFASGQFDNGGRQRIQPKEEIAVEQGDVIFLIVNARDNNHSCDTTHIELKLLETAGEKRVWNLASDVVDNILSGNPLPDSLGHRDIWHFGALANQTDVKSAIPANSALAHWRASILTKKDPKDLEKQTAAVQAVLSETDRTQLTEADQKLHGQLLNWRGPLDWLAVGRTLKENPSSRYGLDPRQFGKHPNGSHLAARDLCFQAPKVLEIRLPAALVTGGEFLATAVLHEEGGNKGSVQVQAATAKPEPNAASLTAPILLPKNSPSRARVETALKAFRELFPPALCYARIVPVDEVVTLTLFYREDGHLQRLMLDEKQTQKLDRLWLELFYISQEPLKTVVALEQISAFATQDRPDLVDGFASMRGPIKDRAETFRKRMIAAEPMQLQGVLQFANRAWRRPLSQSETEKLKAFYRSLRQNEIPHEEALHLLLARVLTSPAFLYKLEQPGPEKKPAPVSDLELATRLSYFLWSSAPDAPLRRLAEAGQLRDEKTLLAETRRMLKNAKTRRLAIQFACQWLHVRDFDQNDDKNEKLYPEFAAMRHEMYEETVRFFEDMIQNDGSVLDILEADHTFLNEALAKHYGIEGIKGKSWRRVEGIKAKGRGGLLGMATVLASQSGASRTSPILRGNWIYETLLGERLPRPPANVPQLPEAVPAGLTARQLIERHSADAACAKCHLRIDPYGFALEQFDALGRLRPQKADTKTTLPGGKSIQGIHGLREYLATERQADVVRQFCRKLLGYALGRELQLSDEPLLSEMQAKLKANDFRFRIAVETIVASPQFRNIRGSQPAESQGQRAKSRSNPPGK